MGSNLPATATAGCLGRVVLNSTPGKQSGHSADHDNPYSWLSLAILLFCAWVIGWRVVSIQLHLMLGPASSLNSAA